MRHLVITIGCEYGAKGNAIGRKIAEDLNIKFYNRELVDEIIEEVGIPKEIMENCVIIGRSADYILKDSDKSCLSGYFYCDGHHGCFLSVPDDVCDIVYLFPEAGFRHPSL